MFVRRLATWTLSLTLAGAFAVVPTLQADGPSCADHPPGDPGAEPVAYVGERVVERRALEERAAPELRALERQHNRLLEDTLAVLVDELLMEAEAERRGLTVEQWLAAEGAADISVSDEEVDAFYETNRVRIRKPKEEVKDQVRDFLAQQKLQSLRGRLLLELRAETPVRSLLAPFRLDFGDLGAGEAPFQGAADAPVVVTLFSDFQCPYCKNIVAELDAVLESHGDRVRLDFRHLPLTSIHPQAKGAAEVAACAERQGKFWEFHDTLFERFGELASDQLMDHADELGLDRKALDRCLDAGQGREAVERDLGVAAAAGISGTPSIFVNGRQVNLTSRPAPREQILKVVEDELKRSGR